MTDYSDFIEREYLLSTIEEYIEAASLEQLQRLTEFIEQNSG